MSDAMQHPYGGRESGRPIPDDAWRAEANPDLGYDGGEGAQEPDPPAPDHDMPGDPPPPRTDLGYDGGEGAEEPDPPDPDHDMPGDPPPPRADLGYDGGEGAQEPDPPDPDHDMPGGDPPPLDVAESNGR